MRQEKEFLLDEIADQIRDFNSFVIMSYLGLEANRTNAFRRSIRKIGGQVEMVPKRMLVKAAEKAGIRLDLNQLTGHIGVVFTGKDPMETTKAVFEFSKTTGEKAQVIGGRIDGETHTAQSMEALSKLPGKDEMRAQFLGLLEAPMAETLAVMDALVASVVYCLDNKCKQE